MESQLHGKADEIKAFMPTHFLHASPALTPLPSAHLHVSVDDTPLVHVLQGLQHAQCNVHKAPVVCQASVVDLCLVHSPAGVSDKQSRVFASGHVPASACSHALIGFSC